VPLSITGKPTGAAHLAAQLAQQPFLLFSLAARQGPRVSRPVGLSSTSPPYSSRGTHAPARWDELAGRVRAGKRTVISRTPRTPPPLPCLRAGTHGWTPHQQHRAAAASRPSAAGVTAPVALTLGRGVTYKFLGRRRPLRSRPLGFSSPFLCCYLSSSAKRGKAEKGKGEGRRAPPCQEATGSPPPSPRLHPRRA
jgi:hypothetical protein